MIGAANLLRGVQFKRAHGYACWEIRRGVRLGWFVGMGLADRVTVDVSRAKARRILAAIAAERARGIRP